VSFEKGMLGTAVSDGSKVVYDFNEKVEHFSHGTGDIFASVFSGALLRGLDKRLSDKINIPFHIADNPLYCVAKGTALALNNLNYPFLMR
jgi:pyridoxal/pyridoxine/pyridoxamine kinase